MGQARRRAPDQGQEEALRRDRALKTETLDGARRRGQARRRRRRDTKAFEAAFGKLHKKWARGHTLSTRKRIDGRNTDEIRQITIRDRRAAARARLGAVHARRDPGARRGDARHQVRREEARHAARRQEAHVLHGLQLPAVLDGRGQAAARPVAPRGRSRLPGRALGRVGRADLRGLPVHDPRRVGHPRVQRLDLDGVGVRRLARADGRRRADEGAGRGHRDGPHEGRRRLRHPVRHPRRRGPPRRHGLQGHRHAPRRVRAADGHQGRRPDPQDPRRGARAGQARPHPHHREDGRRDLGGRATKSRCSRRASSTVQVKPDKVRDIIGPGGKTIRAIQEQTGAQIDINDNGTVSIASSRHARASSRRRR